MKGVGAGGGGGGVRNFQHDGLSFFYHISSRSLFICITVFHLAFWNVSYVALSSTFFLVFVLDCVAPHAV